MEAPQRALITGCSSGIGKALCLEFHRRGHRVIATARRRESIDDLAALGMTTLALDVSNPAQIQDAVGGALDQHGGIDVLVNNAGVLAVGPLTEMPLEMVSLQLEVNVTGVVAVVQAVAPAMIAQRSGRIVNIGSASGILPTPFSGAYCASKAAVHALSDVLRAELSPFGIKVISVQSGGVVSRIGDKALQALRPLPRSSPYASLEDVVKMRAMASQASARAVGPYAEQLVSQILETHPKAVVRIGDQSRLLPILRSFLPQRVRDRILVRKFRLDSLGQGA